MIFISKDVILTPEQIAALEQSEAAEEAQPDDNE